jgi:cytochrome c peroxidase
LIRRSEDWIRALQRNRGPAACADIGKLKGPVLRGLAARAPYFHNGSAASLQDVVEFYDQRFSIGLSKQDKADLVVFLNSL